MNNVRFVLLMRHANNATGGTPVVETTADSHLHEIAMALGNLPEPVRRELSNEGKIETKAVAERVKEYTAEWGEPFELAAILVAESDEAQATAAIVHQEFSQATLETVRFLTPKFAFATSVFKEGDAPALTDQLKNDVSESAARIEKAGQPGNAILLVGHQPLLGWLSYAFAGEAHPLANSEMLCLDLKEPFSAGLRWAVSPSDPEAVEELKEKIKSKMDVAKLLSTFLGAGLSFLLATTANRDAMLYLGCHIWPFAVGSVCLLVALGCFLWTMCSYDTLLMPHRMWAETPQGRSARPTWLVARPPSPVHWILYQNMIRIWQWQFLPATALMLAGFCILFCAVFGSRLVPNAVAAFCYGGVTIPLILFLAYLAWRNRRDLLSAWPCPGVASKVRHLCGPWLGSED